MADGTSGNRTKGSPVSTIIDQNGDNLYKLDPPAPEPGDQLVNRDTSPPPDSRDTTDDVDPDIERQSSIMDKITNKLKVPSKIVAIIMAGINIGLLVFDIFRMLKDLRKDKDEKKKLKKVKR